MDMCKCLTNVSFFHVFSSHTMYVRGEPKAPGNPENKSILLIIHSGIYPCAEQILHEDLILGWTLYIGWFSIHCLFIYLPTSSRKTEFLYWCYIWQSQVLVEYLPWLNTMLTQIKRIRPVAKIIRELIQVRHCLQHYMWVSTLNLRKRKYMKYLYY